MNGIWKIYGEEIIFLFDSSIVREGTRKANIKYI